MKSLLVSIIVAGLALNTIQAQTALQASGEALSGSVSSPAPISQSSPVQASSPSTTPHSSPLARSCPALPPPPPTPENLTPFPTSSSLASTPPGEAPHAQPVNSPELVTRLQIFLDKQNFGPGIIDGKWGEFTAKALLHYARAHHLAPDISIYQELPLDSVFPIYTDYTISGQDAAMVGPSPTKPSEQAKLERMVYPSLLIFLEERFHASPDFLKKLNHGKDLEALKVGDIVRVPNVIPFKVEEIKKQKIPDHPEFELRSVFVNVQERMLDLYDGSQLIASFPITPGSKTLPAPAGVWSIIEISTLPEFRWDKEMLEHGHRSATFFEIPSGPRNPVGILWCGLDKPGIGIHGTSTPETIGRASSHGCIRLANWDAAKFSTMVTTDIPVTIY